MGEAVSTPAGDLAAADFPPPRTPGACEECLKEGTRWVELRECQACGHVGCCDSSPRQHATKHFHEAGHPVMLSVCPARRGRGVRPRVGGELGIPDISMP